MSKSKREIAREEIEARRIRIEQEMEKWLYFQNKILTRMELLLSYVDLNKIENLIPPEIRKE